MEDFIYYNPTKIIFGRNSMKSIASEFIELGCHKILILSIGDLFMKNGLISDIEDNLKGNNIEFVNFNDLESNPLVSSAQKAAQYGVQENVDGVLAVGGGSAIDVAKAVGVSLANHNTNLNDLILGKDSAKTTYSVGVVSTMAGSGSESSASMILTVDDDMMKRAFSSDIIRPKFAILNPEITFSLPKYQMIAGGCDILMHTMDRYFSPSKDTRLIDHISESLLSTVMESIIESIKNPDNYNARATLMWAGNISHNGLTGTARIADWAPHRLEHELSGKFNVIHGAGLCAIWGSWAKYVYLHDLRRFLNFAVNVMRVENNFDNPERVARDGIEKMERFFKDVGMPTNLGELGIIVSENDIQEMTDKCLYNSDHIGSFMPLYKKDIEEIYRNSRGDVV